jgi:hypothetical protein
MEEVVRLPGETPIDTIDLTAEDDEEAEEARRVTMLAGNEENKVAVALSNPNVPAAAFAEHSTVIEEVLRLLEETPLGTIDLMAEGDDDDEEELEAARRETRLRGLVEQKIGVAFSNQKVSTITLVDLLLHDQYQDLVSFVSSLTNNGTDSGVPLQQAVTSGIVWATTGTQVSNEVIPLQLLLLVR